MKAPNLSIPSFNITDPQLWFIRLENYFLSNRINLQWTKFGHANTLLSDKEADDVREALAKPDPERPYDVLKQAVINTASLTDQ